MRWVNAILLILLMILGMASPALSADYRHNYLINIVISLVIRWCPSICPNRLRWHQVRVLVAFWPAGRPALPRFCRRP